MAIDKINIGDELEPKVNEIVEEVNEIVEEVNDLQNETEYNEYSLIPTSGWDTSSTWGLPKAIKIGRVVYLEGFSTGGSANSNMITSIPSEIRPSNPMRFKTASAGAETLVQVNTNGTIACQGTNTTNIFLDGINYIV